MESERALRVVAFLIVFLVHQVLQEQAWTAHIGEVADPSEVADLWAVLSWPLFAIVPRRLQVLHFQMLLVANSAVWALGAAWIARLVAPVFRRRRPTRATAIPPSIADIAPLRPGQPGGGLGMEAATGTRTTTHSTPRPYARTLGSGRYELRSSVGAGGFGTVYRARDHVRGLDVAIKTLDIQSVPPADRPRFRQTFQREASLAGRLDHHAIVAVLDHDADAEEPYIVMSFITGGTLRQRLDGLPAGKCLPWVEVVEIGTQIAQALEYARQRGVVAHRDVKPENIFRGDSGYKLGDFGVAWAASGPVPPSAAPAGAGTSGYMAPEQLLAAAAVDWRADLYSLCAVLYEALTGMLPYHGFRPPHGSERAPQALQPIIAAASTPLRPLREIASDVPGHVAAAIERGLHFDRAKRFAGWEEFIRTLRGESRTR